MIINLAALAAELTAGNHKPRPAQEGPFALKPLNLEQLRKQAKELLDGWQSSDAASLARVVVHPDASGLQHRPPQLADAQQVIALEHGFRRWDRLKHFIDVQTMTRAAQLSGNAAAPDAGPRTLHIAIEDVGSRPALAGFTGDFLFFPYPRAMVPTCGLPEPHDIDQFFAAYYLADRATWAPMIKRRGIEAEAEWAGADGHDQGRFAGLVQARNYERVYLWSGPLVSEFKYLAFLLAHFARPENRPQSLELVAMRRFPGVERLITFWQLPPEALRQVATWFRPVRVEQFATGRRVWHAFSSVSPMELWRLIQDGSLEPLMWEPEATRVLEQLPALHDGLGEPERLMLEALASGEELNVRAVSAHVHLQTKLPSYYWPWEVVSWRLSQGREPAIKTWRKHHPEHADGEHWFQITDVGRELLAGKRHWMELATEPYWVGGVEIDPAKPHWCWDHEAQKPVSRQV
jgi:hypothetical protein